MYGEFRFWWRGLLFRSFVCQHFGWCVSKACVCVRRKWVSIVALHLGRVFAERRSFAFYLLSLCNLIETKLGLFFDTVLCMQIRVAAGHGYWILWVRCISHVATGQWIVRMGFHVHQIKLLLFVSTWKRDVSNVTKSELQIVCSSVDEYDASTNIVPTKSIIQSIICKWLWKWANGVLQQKIWLHYCWVYYRCAKVLVNECMREAF